jgi:hypothetical protein
MALDFDQVVEGVGAAQLAGMDQAHELIADLRTVQGAIVQYVLTMQNGALQGSFDDIVIKRGSGLSEEQRQPQPVAQQIVDRLAQSGVGFRPSLRQLRFQPEVQLAITGVLRS